MNTWMALVGVQAIRKTILPTTPVRCKSCSTSSDARNCPQSARANDAGSTLSMVPFQSMSYVLFDVDDLTSWAGDRSLKRLSIPSGYLIGQEISTSSGSAEGFELQLTKISMQE